VPFAIALVTIRNLDQLVTFRRAVAASAVAVLISCNQGSNEAATAVDSHVDGSDSTVDIPGSTGNDEGEAGAAIEDSDPSDRGEPSVASPVLRLADSVIETFHDSDLNTCGTTKIHIDGPVRGFKDHNGVIHLTVSDPNAQGWQWTGLKAAFVSRPTAATRDCIPIMQGNSGNTDVTAFDQKTWIQALHFSAPTIHAYGHEDYFGTRTSEPGCHQAGTSDGLPYCWYASIALWQAVVQGSDSHLVFSRSGAAPDHVAIYPNVQYPGHASTPSAGWIGYGTPSNIVRGRNADGSLDGYFYMLAYTNSGYANQPKGVCLFRTSNPALRTSWRAWNGSASSPAFTQQMQNPYGAPNSPCAVVSPDVFQSYVRSIQWHAASQHYIAIFRDEGAVRYATSSNLLTWKGSAVLLTSTDSQASYPVIVDFDGGDLGDENFDSIHARGNTYLFYRKSIAPGHTRITRRALTISNYPVEGDAG
jgi:hypothetical protein